MGLMGSVPSQNKRGERLIQIPGMAPSLLNRPTGCAFRPRCTKATQACLAEPDMTEPMPRRAARCFHPLLAGAAA
jgi:peptide/nickel transport system ATP-binding protein